MKSCAFKLFLNPPVVLLLKHTVFYLYVEAIPFRILRSRILRSLRLIEMFRLEAFCMDFAVPIQPFGIIRNNRCTFEVWFDADYTVSSLLEEEPCTFPATSSDI